MAAIGANHGAGLQAALRALDEMGGDGLPLAALPNIGLEPRGRPVVYPHATPEYFAEFAAHARDLGARVIGGCCGTTPAEIAAIRAAVDRSESRRAVDFASASSRRSLRRRRGGDRARSSAPRRRVGRLGAARPAARRGQQRPARGRARGRRLGPCRVRGHQRQPAARVGISALMTAVAIERESGIETIPHLTPRDDRDGARVRAARRARGGRSERARGHGRPAGGGRLSGSRGVYEVDAIGLTQLVAG